MEWNGGRKEWTGNGQGQMEWILSNDRRALFVAPAVLKFKVWSA